MKNRFNEDELIDRYLTNRCTPEEKEAFERHYIQFLERKGKPLSAIFFGQTKAKNYKQLYASIERERTQSYKIRRIWISAAAVVVFLIGLGVFFRQNIQQQTNLTKPSKSRLTTEVKPGEYKATLRFSDGREFTLDGTKQGIRFQKKQITYQDGSSLTNNSDLLNFSFSNETVTLAVPRGGQYQAELDDGTKVWLNAASTLHYAIGAENDTREVELEGEAYFMVTPSLHVKGKVMPFTVRSGTQVIHVLGTEFNVHAYPDEHAMRTTLTQGRIQVADVNGGQPVTLAPGQAAINSESKVELSVVQADVEREIAWKNGYFIFNNENIINIMQRISRWYDIEVSYQGDMRDKKFGGIFQRSKSIEQLLDKLAQTGLIDFKISGRRVVVMEK